MKMNTVKELVNEKADDAKRAANILRIARFHQARTSATMKFMDAVLKRFDETKDGLNAYVWIDVSAYDASEDHAVTVHITLNAKISSMKEGLVPRVIKVLMDAGFDTKKTEDYVTDWTGMRIFSLERPVNEKHFRVVIEFQATVVKAADATCRKIQVGVELKEVPKYALECDSPSEAEIAAAT